MLLPILHTDVRVKHGRSLPSYSPNLHVGTGRFLDLLPGARVRGDPNTKLNGGLHPDNVPRKADPSLISRGYKRRSGYGGTTIPC